MWLVPLLTSKLELYKGKVVLFCIICLPFYPQYVFGSIHMQNESNIFQHENHMLRQGWVYFVDCPIILNSFPNYQPWVMGDVEKSFYYMDLQVKRYLSSTIILKEIRCLIRSHICHFTEFSPNLCFLVSKLFKN